MKHSKYKNIINKSEALQTEPYDLFVQSLPKELDYYKDGSKYRLKAAWKAYGEPKTYQEALWNGLVETIGGTYRMPSIGYNEKDDNFEYLNTGESNGLVDKDIHVWENEIIPLVRELKNGGYFRIFDEDENCWKYTRSQELIEKFQLGGKYKSGQTCDTPDCARFSNSELRNNDFMISGNAWNLKNADLLYSGYDSKNYPLTWDKKAVEKYNYDAAEKFYKEFDSKTLDKNQVYVVNMYYQNSPAQERAYYEGRDKMTGTHTGYVAWNPDTNRWEVTHNIHGTIHVDPFTKIQRGGKKYGITGIFIPREKSLLNKLRSIFRTILGFGEGGSIEYFEEGGKTKKPYKEWVKTVNPEYVNDTYDLEKAYEELPIEKLEQWRLNTLKPEAGRDPSIHLDDGSSINGYKKPNHMTYTDKGYGWQKQPDNTWTFVVSPRQQVIWPFEEYVKYWNNNEPEALLNYNGRLYKRSIGQFKEGGQLNLIPEGSLHSRKNHLEGAGEDFTSKGIPVLSLETKEQVAEIEHSELILNLDTTEKVEKYLKEFKEAESDSKKDEIAIKCGKMLCKSIIENTDDRMDLIVKVENDL